MIIASYNLNNLFERATILELEGFSPTAREVLNDISKLNVLLAKDSYAGATGTAILTLIKKYFGANGKKENKYFFINEIKNKLTGTTNGELVLRPIGKDDWLGWIELKKSTVNEAATQNTALVVKEIKADVMCVIEVDDRIALNNFNKYLLEKEFKYALLIDGNDERGIDVGVLSKYEVVNIETHIYDTYKDENGKTAITFSRDCAIYTIKKGNTLVYLLCNHFKSQGYGRPEDNNNKRAKQAEAVAQIIKRYNLNKDYVVIAGDLNDVPDSEPLKVLRDNNKLVNIAEQFGLEHTGTYDTGKKQFDYLWVSNALASKFVEGNIERRGIFSKKGEKFETVTSKANQASDHAAVWAKFDI